jgi:tRNA nucleotidyltransferase (CCA-adding enzyme)
MALRLDGPDAGALLDPLDGEADLHAGLIRVLHEGSFQDDATRILRAARYRARFRFQMEPKTLAWLRHDTSCLQAISGARLHREFARLFREAEPEGALALLEETGALAAIHPGLCFPPERSAALGWLRSAHPQGLATACWPLLAAAATPGQASGAAGRVALTKTQALAVEAMPRLRELVGVLKSPLLSRSDLVDMLAPFPVSALWAFAAIEGGLARDRCLDYLERARHLKPALRGDDVIALGVTRGPEVGEALRRLRTAKLNGEVKTRRDEERFVRSLLAGAPAR